MTASNPDITAMEPARMPGSMTAGTQHRILLLLRNGQDRRLLADWLRHRYGVLMADSDDAIRATFDLCIIDGVSLEALGDRVRERKRAERQGFLPILLVTPLKSVRMVTHHLWESVDELIVSPIQKVELEARLEILLRARDLSVQNTALSFRLETELARAAEVQTELLPRSPPPLRGFQLSARCIPARQVGGDFFDWKLSSDGGQLSVTVGDAMGKGMPAALLMATVRAALRAVAGTHPPAVALDLTARALQNDLMRSFSLVTLFHAQLRVDERRISYVDAGHGHVFVRRREGHLEPLRAPCPALGIPVEEGYQSGSVDFRPGDALVVYSDGLEFSARDPSSRDAMAGRLASANSAEAMVQRMFEIDGRSENAVDDRTALVLYCCG